MNNKILDEIKKDKELNDLIKNLSSEELDDNLPILFKQLKDLRVCKLCKGKECFNDPLYLQSHLENDNGTLHQVYKPCKYKALQFSSLYMPNIDEGEIIINENRVKIFSKISEAKNGGKGIYLHGAFGCGKTYIMYKLAKEIAKEKEVIFVYYPELINNIKISISRFDESYYNLIERLKKVDVLFLDDIGREQNSSYNRDQILSPILQYRASNNLQTFMTSNYNIRLLQDHLTESKDGLNSINSSAIIERICYLMNIVNLDDKNYRV